MDIVIKVLKALWTVVVVVVGGILGLIGGALGWNVGGPAGGPRPALPPGSLPSLFEGVWSGTMRDNSPNTYSDGYSCVLDLRSWRVSYGPSGPGHGGAEGQVRLVVVGTDCIEVEEDLGRGESIDYAVDGVFTLRLANGGSELHAKWRSQYPERDIYVGSGTLRKS